MTSSTDTPELLDALIRVPAPSGYETPAAEVWRDAAGAIDGGELRTDTLGSSVVEVAGADGAPRLAIVGHIDEIGLHVTYIDDDGFLWFGPIGGWDPQILVGQRVTVVGFDGEVPGVLGKKPIHLLKDDDRKKPAKLEQMHIDIGAADREEAETMVRIGDSGRACRRAARPSRTAASSRARWTTASAPTSRWRSRAASPRRAATPASVIGCAVAQEEIGLGGARTTGFSLDPDLAVAVDVTHATDAPGIDKKENGDHALGSGPVIGRGSTLNHRVCQLLVETAEAEGIDHTIEASGRYTGTDADAIQLARGGIPSGLVSLPLRYMHSSVEMVQLSDVENAIKLLVAFAGRLEADSEFGR